MSFRLTTDVPSCSIIGDLRCTSSNGEDSLSDEDEYLCKFDQNEPSIIFLPCMLYEHPLLVCDDCNMLYHGECPVHGPLSELDPTAGYDQASLAYTQLPVPAQLTIRPSPIPGAELGVFSTTFISKGVRVGPYLAETVDKDDMGGLHNSTNAGEVINGMFLYVKTEILYSICDR